MKRFALLLLVLSVLLSGCFWGSEESAADVTEAAGSHIWVQLSEPYDAPIRQALALAGWVLRDTDDGCGVLVTDRLQDTALPQILPGSQPQAGAYTICFDPETTAATQVGLLSQLPYGGDMNRDGVITYAIIAPTGSSYKTACREAMSQLALPAELLSEEVCKDEQSVGRQVAARILASYGKDLDVLLCGSEPLSLGAAEAGKDAGRDTRKDLALLTVGQDVKHCSGTVWEDPQALAEGVSELVRRLLAGQTPPAHTRLPLTATVTE